MNKALLLDRDGVINKEINYLHRIGDFEFIDGVFETCRIFQERQYLLIVITNQAGIGRGYYTEEDFWKLTEWMTAQFQANGVEISKTYFCPFHPTEGVGRYRKDSFDRKPKPGMILKARDDFDLNLDACILIGDKESDIQAGFEAGVGTKVLVKSGHAVQGNSQADFIIDSVKQLPDAFGLE
ncbi:HAD family hydrolase [bacterium]|nr:HAD family hydrolase [bacterium]